ENFKLLRAGLIAQELKRQNLISSIVSVSNGVVNGRLSSNDDLAKPTSIGMQNILPQLQVIRDLMADVLPPAIKRNLNLPDLNNYKKYNVNYLDNIYQLIETDFAILGKKSKEHLRDILYNTSSTKKDILRTL